MNFSTPQDAYALMNELTKQAQAVNAPEAVDLSTFIDAGQATLATGVENVLNSLHILIARTVVDSKAYTGKLKLMEASGSIFNNRMRKITFYPRYEQEAGFYNTNLNTPLGDGKDNTAAPGTMWEQNNPILTERFFGGRVVWDRSDTTYLVQLQNAFKDPAEFNAFINGKMTEMRNDIEQTKEAYNRAALINHIAGTYKMVQNGDLGIESAVNLVAAYNTEFGTTYTKDELVQEHMPDLLKFYAAKVKIDSDRLTERTKRYHWTMPKTVDSVTHEVLRHTPKADQRFIYYAPFMTKAKANVFPEIFNPEYIQLQDGEGVNFWQSFDEPEGIKATPSIPTGTTGEVTINNVIGVLYDKDALMLNYDFEGAYTTPIEARKLYYNTWYHYAKNTVDDFSENTIIYYLA